MLITFSNILNPDQARQNVRPALDPNCLTLSWYSWKNFLEKLILKEISRQQKIKQNYAVVRVKCIHSLRCSLEVMSSLPTLPISMLTNIPWRIKNNVDLQICYCVQFLSLQIRMHVKNMCCGYILKRTVSMRQFF